MRNIKKDCNNIGYKPLQGRKAPQTSEQATRAWEKFGGKKPVLNALLKEQYRLCCYSELRADQEGLGYHIEHVENKGNIPQRTFDCTNLVASAITDESVLKNQGYEVFGGHAIGKKVGCDMSRFISPHQVDCSRYFAYLSDGRIVPSEGLTQYERECADYTIKLLNLDCEYLRVKRKNWWKELESSLCEYEDKNLSIEKLAESRILPDNNALESFFTLTRQFFGQIAEQTLQNHAPQLV
jgi:uncharacterized protein (TIGR02646 family)